VLVYRQALDAGDKDGTTRHLIGGVNPQGVDVSSFRTPSAKHLDHDELHGRFVPRGAGEQALGATDSRGR